MRIMVFRGLRRRFRGFRGSAFVQIGYTGKPGRSNRSHAKAEDLRYERDWRNASVFDRISCPEPVAMPGRWAVGSG